MDDTRQNINHVLTALFNDILRIEQNEICSGKYSGLTMREMHVLEAIRAAGEGNTMAVLAKKLHITAGTLTVAIISLEKKGFVVRDRSQSDRRMVHVVCTEAGRRAALRHMRFHEEMTDSILALLDKEEAGLLSRTLFRINDYFTNKEAGGA